jgi:hypothetical protein
MCECIFRKCVASSLLLLIFASSLSAQTPQQSPQRPAAPQTPQAPTHADILRGEYGRYRANNDLLFYHLDIRVDPEKKFVSGKNTIRFRMLKNDTRIQLDLYDNLKIEKILVKGSGDRGRGSGSEGTPLKYERDSGAVFVDFPEMLKAGRIYTIDFYYSGTPQTIGRFGGLHLWQGSGRPAVDLHRLRGRRRQHLVAEQGPVEGRTGVDANQRPNSEQPR